MSKHRPDPPTPPPALPDDPQPTPATVVKPHRDAQGNAWVVIPGDGTVEVTLTTPSGHQVSGTFDTEDQGRAFLLAFITPTPADSGTDKE